MPRLDEHYNVNDTYKIKKDWADFTPLCEEFEKQLTSFLSHTRNKTAGIRARKALKDMFEHLEKIRKKTLKQSQDYEGDYS